MMVSGLSVLRNVIMLGYPFTEAIRSALPVCDEFIVVVGKSEDGTLEAVRAMNEPKIRIIETEWSEKTMPQDCVLAQQTNIGLHICRGDWVVYLQANEILHDQSLPNLTALMDKYKDESRVESLLLERLVFWGDYRHVVRVYPHRFKFSPRIIKPYLGMYAVRGAMGFGVFENFALRGRYPYAVDTGENLFRYGLVGTPEMVKRKEDHATHMKYYPKKRVDENYFYQDVPKSHIALFRGTHPEVMREKVEAFTANLQDDDPRWRLQPTWKERQRLWETAYYERFGIPRIRSTRYKLRGAYVPKPACY